jgi:acyl-CoA synthetase (AMP-forming)/AMP-acid ligase II
MKLQWLWERLEGFQGQTALIWQERTYPYADLLDRTAQWRDVLGQRGIEPGACVALHGGFSPGAATLLLALAANRNIAVPLTTPVEAERDRCLEIAEAQWLFQFHRDDAWELTKREETRQETGAGSGDLFSQFRALGEPGLILLSSGSTGQIKAALHNFSRVLANYQGRQTRPYRTLAFLMLDHIGGVNTLLHILTSGGTLVTPAERTPEAIAEGIQRHRVQLLPATPTFLRMLLISEAHKKYDLSSLELITYGTEPMPTATLESLHAAFPGVRLKQTYGLTEVGILPTKSEQDDSLWLAVGGLGYETKIVDNVLWIRAQMAMVGYLNAPSPFDADGWFNTGDVVEQRGDYIRFMGRKSEIINVGGEKVFPAEIENFIQQLENVKEVTVRGRPSPITGNIIVATVELLEPEDPDDLEERVRAACRRRLAPFKVPAMVEMASKTLCGDRFKKIRKVKGAT